MCCVNAQLVIEHACRLSSTQLLVSGDAMSALVTMLGEIGLDHRDGAPQRGIDRAQLESDIAAADDGDVKTFAVQGTAPMALVPHLSRLDAGWK